MTKIVRTIETPRCLCAPLTESDFPNAAKLYTNHQVRRFLGGVAAGEFSQDRFITLFSAANSLTWAVTAIETGEFIGLIFLGRHHDGDDMEVSYQFLPESWGKGLASETVGVIVDFARDCLHLRRIVAETQTANVRSKALLERLGMRPVRWLKRFGEEQVVYERQFESRARGDNPETL
jgi:ribosomal-protein-alanine N-acetyltransferase